MAEQRQQCIDAGMSDHVAKPIVPERLVETILRHANHARAHPASPSPGLPDLPGIDVAGALRRVNQDTAAYLRLLRRLVSGHAGSADQIGAALAAGNRHEAERIAPHPAWRRRQPRRQRPARRRRNLETTLRRGTGGRRNPGRTSRPVGRAAEPGGPLLETRLPLPPGRRRRPDDAAPYEQARSWPNSCATRTALRPPSGPRPDLITRIGIEKTAQISNAIQHYDYDEALARLSPCARGKPPCRRPRLMHPIDEPSPAHPRRG